MVAQNPFASIQSSSNPVSLLRADTIMFPEAPLALRLSGQLVLGVVRVYFRQLEFLDDDAAAAFTKLLKVNRPEFHVPSSYFDIIKPSNDNK